VSRAPVVRLAATVAVALALAAAAAGAAEDPVAALLSSSERLAPSDPERAQRLAAEALGLARAGGDRRGQARALNRLGVARYYAGQYEAAYADYGESLRIAESIGDPELAANALNNIGVLHYLWGSLDRALDYYRRALDLRAAGGDRAGTARSLNNLGGVSDAAGRYEEAIEYFRRAIELYDQLGERELAISARNNAALSLLHLDRFDEARAELDRALAEAEAIGDLSGVATAEDHRGLLLREAGRTVEARAAFERALELRTRIGDRPGTAAVLEHLGAAAADLGDYDAAAERLESAIALAVELDVPQLERDAWLRRAEVEQRRGDTVAALDAFRRYHEVHARLVSDASSRRLAEMRALLELEKKSGDIDRLSRERANQRTLLAAFAVALVLLAAVVVLLWSRSRLEDRARREIESRNEALRRAHEELERSSQAEVAHLARVVSLGELTAAVAHELNQPLSAILTNAEVASSMIEKGRAEPAEVRAAIDDIALGARRSWEVLRHLRRLARRGEVERERVALGEVAAEAVEIAGAEARLRATELLLEGPRPGPEVLGDPVHLQQVILNLLQNAITASAEATPPRRVRLRAIGEGDRAVVAVEDAGPPIADEVLSRLFEPFFTTRAEGLGMGLAISRRLVEAHGGRMWARRREGAPGGLVVGFDLPLAPGT
jgi:signal transduction histidine kinase